MAARLIIAAMTMTVLGCAGASDERTDWAPAPKTVDGLTVLAESDEDGFRLHTASGEKSFLPGINLGSTTPLHQPGEVAGIDASNFRRWLAQMGELGTRVVRIYTLLPPGFYEELDRYNKANPKAPLYLVQGVYLPNEEYNQPGRTLFDPEIDQAFSEEIEAVHAGVHGDLVRPVTPGRAHGTYDTDVSKWLASWIIGVEWDPQGVVQTNKLSPQPHQGTYFRTTADASPTEQWIARHMDDLAALEAKRGTSVPIAMANWPTADPITHPTEPLRTEDLVGVDANHVLPTDQWPGGTFASFHAYPYYPDFQRYEKGYDETTWRGEPDRYAGYLMQLKEHFAPHMPLLITEYGVPSSIGSAHLGTEDHQGRTRDQGGHSERQAMEMNAEMMRMMEHQGLGGAFVFAWADEWFKRTWNTMDHQDPERRQLWHDPLTNEQWFGLLATDSELGADAAVEELPESGPIEYVYVRGGGSFVLMDIKFRDEIPDDLRIDADVLPGPERADYRVEVGEDEAQAWVRRELDPIRLDTSERPYRPDQAEEWHRYQLLINRSYPGRPAEYQDVGQLVEGVWDPESDDYNSLATWHRDEEQRTIRLRIPWPMLGMADPSALTALGEGEPAEMVTVDGIDLTFATGEESLRVPFTWQPWNRIEHTERLKAGVGEVEKAMRELAP